MRTVTLAIEGSVALVTGANRGLCAAFADADPRLAVLRLELTDRASIDEAASAARDVTIVINNAGVDTGTPTLGDEAGLRRELEINYLGPVAVSRAFAPVLAANGGGVLVNMLSGLAWMSLPTTGGYSSAKAAMWAAINSLRQNLAEQGTLVTAVYAGYLDGTSAERCRDR